MECNDYFTWRVKLILSYRKITFNRRCSYMLTFGIRLQRDINQLKIKSKFCEIFECTLISSSAAIVIPLNRNFHKWWHYMQTRLEIFGSKHTALDIYI